jgi:hypothetical protein
MDKEQKQNADREKQSQSQDSNVGKQSEQKQANREEQLTTEDLPDSTNESQGNTGSGQRQDSN